MATVNSYSRDQEAEADAEGVRRMRAAGWDPLALARFFDVLKAEHDEGPELLAWMSTHPQHDERIDAIKHQIESLPDENFTPIDVDWNEVRQRVGGN